MSHRTSFYDFIPVTGWRAYFFKMKGTKSEMYEVVMPGWLIEIGEGLVSGREYPMTSVKE